MHPSVAMRHHCPLPTVTVDTETDPWIGGWRLASCWHRFRCYLGGPTFLWVKMGPTSLAHKAGRTQPQGGAFTEPLKGSRTEATRLSSEYLGITKANTSRIQGTWVNERGAWAGPSSWKAAHNKGVGQETDLGILGTSVSRSFLLMSQKWG